MKTIKSATLVAIAASMMMLSLTQCNTQPAAPAAAEGATTETAASGLRIAYVDIDTLLTSYEFWVSLNEEMMNKRENITATLNQKANAWQKEADDFQKKMENNAFVSQQRAESEYNRILKKKAELEELQERLGSELATESAKNDQIIRDSINNFLADYNREHKYDIILSRIGDNILYIDAAMNITQEIADGLNARYSSQPAE